MLCVGTLRKITIMVIPSPINWNCFNGALYGFPPAMLLRRESDEIIIRPPPLRINGIMTSSETNDKSISTTAFR